MCACLTVRHRGRGPRLDLVPVTLSELVVKAHADAVERLGCFVGDEQAVEIFMQARRLVGLKRLPRTPDELLRLAVTVIEVQDAYANAVGRSLKITALLLGATMPVVAKEDADTLDDMPAVSSSG